MPAGRTCRAVPYRHRLRRHAHPEPIHQPGADSHRHFHRRRRASRPVRDRREGFAEPHGWPAALDRIAYSQPDTFADALVLADDFAQPDDFAVCLADDQSVTNGWGLS